MLLLARAELRDGRDPERHRRLERDRAARVGASDLLHGEAVRQEIATGAADLLGKRQREQPEPGHPRDEVVRELAGLVVVRGTGRDLRLREVADHVPNVTLLVTEIEIHLRLTVARRTAVKPSSRRGHV